MHGGATAKPSHFPASAPPFRGGLASVDIGDVVRVLISRARWLAPCLALTLAGALVYVSVTPKTYVAKFSMFVDPRDPTSLGIEAPALPENPDSALIESQMRLMTSATVLRRVAESEIRHSISSSPSMEDDERSATPQAAKTENESSEKVRLLADELGKDVFAQRSEKDYIIYVEMRAPSPELAERRARALVDAYFAIDTKINDDATSRQALWLDQRIADLRGRTEAAENQVQTFKVEQALVVTGGELPSEQQLKDADAALVTSRSKRAEVEGRFEQIKAAMNGGANVDAVLDAIHAPVMQRLREEYAALAGQEASTRSVLGPLHPTYLTIRAQVESMRSQITAEMKHIAIATERELAAAVSDERNAERQVKSLETATNGVGLQRNKLSELEREATALRTTYEKAMAARENVPRNAVHSALATLVGPPVAGVAPVAPRLTPALLVAVAFGVNLWAVLALLTEYRTRTSRLDPKVEGGKSRSLGSRFRKEKIDPLRVFSATDLFAESPDLRGAADQAGAEEPELRAIRRNMRSRAVYAQRVQEILDVALEAAGATRLRSERAPLIAIAGVSPNVGASTLAVSLAEQAAAAGAQVLIDDRDPHRSSAIKYTQVYDLAFLSPHGRPILVLRPRGSNGGVILVTGPKLAGRRGASDVGREKVDIILVDAGPLSQLETALQDVGAVDALVVVDREDADPSIRDRDMERSQSMGPCACLVLTPSVRRRPV
jgi:succinoglycan biosynthesis transport protein ExoP